MPRSARCTRIRKWLRWASAAWTIPATSRRARRSAVPSSCSCEIALESGKPLFLHQRDAHADFVSMMRNFDGRLGPAVVHCFTGTREELFDCLVQDWLIGITGWLCDERRGQHLRELVRHIPADRLMIETDAPYLLPRTVKPAPAHRRNEPLYLAPHRRGTRARPRRGRRDHRRAEHRQGARLLPPAAALTAARAPADLRGSIQRLAMRSLSWSGDGSITSWNCPPRCWHRRWTSTIRRSRRS